MEKVPMPINWTEKVNAAITNLEDGSKVLEPRDALAVIDDVVKGKLDAAELAMIHRIPQHWIKATLGHVTRAVQGTGRVLPLAAEGWYAFHGHEQPYEVAPGFVAAWKLARGLSDRSADAFSSSSLTTIKDSLASKAPDDRLAAMDQRRPPCARQS